MAYPINTITAVDLAPDSVTEWTDSFEACLCGDGFWGVDQVTRWTGRGGEPDSEGCGIAYGLSESEARSLAERLTVSQRPADAVAA